MNLLLTTNFLPFIIGFSISVIYGTYLLFSYRRSNLLWSNIAMFYLCAIRFACEYYLHQIESWHLATLLSRFSSVALFGIAILIWICSYLYINPFRSFRHKTKIDSFYFIFLVALPALIGIYGLISRKIYVINSVKLDGYWKFKTIDGWIGEFHSIHTFLIMTCLICSILIFNIYTTKVKIRSKILLLLVFIVLPFYYAQLFDFTGPEGWRIPSGAVPILIQVSILTWFVSDYRMFSNQLESITIDMLNSLSDLAIIVGVDQKIKFGNAQFDSQFGKQVDKNVIDFFSSFSGKTSNELDVLIRKEEKKILTLTDKVGRKHTFRIASNEVKNNSRISQTIILTDITEIVQREKLLSESNAIKDTLFSIIGHDLRKPVLGFRNITKKINYLIEEKSFEQLMVYGQSIEHASHVLNKLLDNLLYWSQIQKKNINLQLSNFPATILGSEIKEMFSHSFLEQRISYFDKTNADHLIHADLNMCLTIFRNLVDNAIKYTPIGGSITLSSRISESRVYIQVVDNGVGMSKNEPELNRDLDPLTSFGIGMHIVNELVEKNNGQMDVQSKIGLGTTVTISFQSRSV